MPGLAALARVGGLGATPAVPSLTYTAEKQFTITDYDATLEYTVSGGTRSGAVITVTTTGVTATVTAKYPRAVLASSARQMLTAAHGIVLDSVASNPGSTGCGPRGDIACPGGTVTGTGGDTYVRGPGTVGDYCGGSCPGNCYGLFGTCWYYHWTDYSGSGYTQQGNVWGKAS